MALRLPDGSRSVQSPWVWRGILLFGLVAGGICLNLAVAGQMVLALCWALISGGWITISLWLWRRHARYNDQVWASR